MLESTGWYEIDRSLVGVAITGRKSGCSYIDSKCVTSYDQKTKIAKVVNQLDFCSHIGQYYHCNDRFTGGGYCGLKGEPKVSEFHVIESNHDYFNGIAMKGGIENCPIIISSNQCWDVSRRIKSNQYF